MTYDLEAIRVDLTYTSNALEGNTLSHAETSIILGKGETVAGKTLTEHLEAVNHAAAFDYVMTLVDSKLPHFAESHILEIHRHLLSRIDDINAGRYRNASVRIAGSRVILPNPAKVPTLMAGFCAWLEATTLPAPELAIMAHLKLVTIHPFIDGNGRTARLLLNLILLRAGYPPAILRPKDRLDYLKVLERAQTTEDIAPYATFMYTQVEQALDRYSPNGGQSQVRDSENKDSAPRLLKIGELAKLCQESVPTLRYWTAQGLLQVAEFTPSGYQLFSEQMIHRAKRIRALQTEERMTIKEIASYLE